MQRVEPHVGCKVCCCFVVIFVIVVVVVVIVSVVVDVFVLFIFNKLLNSFLVLFEKTITDHSFPKIFLGQLWRNDL